MEHVHSHEINISPEITATPPRILPGETLLEPEFHLPRVYPEHPSSLEQLLFLTRANHLDEIGDRGTIIASKAMEASSLGVEKNTDYLHLFEVPFMRDAIRCCNFLNEQFPKLTRTTLLTGARYQGVRFDPGNEEEEGRIAHEIRDPATDKFAQQLTEERGWEWPYYATADATPEYVRLLSTYVQMSPNHHSFIFERYTDRNGDERTMLDSMDNAIQWINDRRKQNPEGIIEFKTTLPKGIEIQSWKDSFDSHHHADGTVANQEKGISSIEVQVGAYDALIDAAEIYENIVGNVEHGTVLRMQASELRKAIFEHYWTEDKGGYFVIGTDRDEHDNLRQLKIRTSNMGHALNSRLLEGTDPEIVRKRDAIVHQLMSPEMLARAGIRTLARDEVRFRPGSYHNGPVWLMDSYYCAFGMRRHGYIPQALNVGQRMMDTVKATGIFPEFVRGEQDTIALNHTTYKVWDEINQKENTIEQPPQEVQAWTVAAVRNFEAWVWEQEAA